MEITFWKLSIYIIIMNYFWCEICLFCPIFYLFIQSSMLLWTHWIFKIWFKLSDSSVYLFYCSLFFFPAMSTRCALIWLLCPSGICESVCVCVCVCVRVCVLALMCFPAVPNASVYLTHSLSQTENQPFFKLS